MVDICAGATFFSCGVVVIVGLFESSGFAGALPPCDGGEMAVCCGGASEDGFCLWSPWSADGTGSRVWHGNSRGCSADSVVVGADGELTSSCCCTDESGHGYAAGAGSRYMLP